MQRLSTILVACLAAASLHAEPLPAYLPGPQDDPDVEEIFERPSDYLARIAQARSMLLIGEIHGAYLAPTLTGDIAERIAPQQPVLVALEWPETEQRAVDAYLASVDGRVDIDALTASKFWQDPRPDGRTSQAMLSLLERLRVLKQGGADVRVVCFDWNWDEPVGVRDAALADRLRAARERHAGAAMIVPTGNYHARIARGAPWDPDLALAGWQLRDLDPFNVDVRALEGSAWICTSDQGCGRHALSAPPGADVSGLFARRTPDERGYWATLTMPMDAASEPVVQR